MQLFFDSKNHPIPIEKLQYSDLTQLTASNIEEGFSVEFKSAYDSNVKDKLPKIITSFANSSGGWLFIGVEGSGVVCDIQKPSGEIYLAIMQKISRILI